MRLAGSAPSGLTRCSVLSGNRALPDLDDIAPMGLRILGDQSWSWCEFQQIQALLLGARVGAPTFAPVLPF